MVLVVLVTLVVILVPILVMILVELLVVILVNNADRYTGHGIGGDTLMVALVVTLALGEERGW